MEATYYIKERSDIIHRFTSSNQMFDRDMEAALDLRGQIRINMMFIARVWGFQNGVKLPDGTTDIEDTT